MGAHGLLGELSEISRRQHGTKGNPRTLTAH